MSETKHENTEEKTTESSSDEKHGDETIGSLLVKDLTETARQRDEACKEGEPRFPKMGMGVRGRLK